jgi:hypothetical protein
MLVRPVDAIRQWQMGATIFYRSLSSVASTGGA